MTLSLWRLWEMDSGQQTLGEKERKGSCVAVCVCLDQSGYWEYLLRSYKDRRVHIVRYRAESESGRKKEGNPVSKAVAPLSFSWHRENIMQPLAPIESAWFIAQFETAKLLNCIRSAKIHSRTTEEIWKIKCHLGTVENFYLYSRDTPNMPHSIMIDGDARLHLTYLVMSCSLQGCLLLENSRKT